MIMISKLLAFNTPLEETSELSANTKIIGKKCEITIKAPLRR